VFGCLGVWVFGCLGCWVFWVLGIAKGNRNAGFLEFYSKEVKSAICWEGFRHGFL